MRLLGASVPGLVVILLLLIAFSFNVTDILASEQHSLSTWSAQLNVDAVIRDIDKWYNIGQNASVEFELQRSSKVVFSYTVNVIAEKPFLPGGDFLNSRSNSGSETDFLATRLLVDGVPYRQSGAHTGALSSFETSIEALHAKLILHLSPGNHVVTLQWRKSGNNVISWHTVNRNSDHYGFSGSATIDVLSEHKYLWFKQPLTSDIVRNTEANWKDIKDMTMTFSVPRTWTFVFSYNFLAQPDRSPNKEVFTAPDFLGARLLIDGKAYREAASISHTVTATHTVASLSGSVATTLHPGEHTVSVQWRKWGEVEWRILPAFGGGFAFGRTLLIYASHHPLHFVQPLSEAMIHSGPVENSTWTDVPGTVTTFPVTSQSMVVFSYAINLAQYGNPNMDSWTWDRWSSISTRLVVDGMPYTHTGSASSALVRVVENLKGSLALPLAGGTHTAKLQWRTLGNSTMMWSSFKRVLDGFGGGRQLLAVVHAENMQPVISAPDTAYTLEDVEQFISGIHVVDEDIHLTPDAEVAVRISATSGTVSLLENEGLSFTLGDGDKDQVVAFSGDIHQVNAALQTIKYVFNACMVQMSKFPLRTAEKPNKIIKI